MAAHFEDVYGAKVSKDTISRITEKVVGEMVEWSSRPFDVIYPVIFVDALVVKVREGQVRNTPFYVVMGVTTAGERDILGIWAGGEGGEGARFWLQVFSELKNRGVADVLIVICTTNAIESINARYRRASRARGHFPQPRPRR